MTLKIKNKPQTRKKILKTAGRLFSQRGYFGTSMEEVAKEVGVGKSALYYHFESKDALCKELMLESCEELKTKLKKAVKGNFTPFDVLFNIVKALLDFRLKHPEIGLLTSVGLSKDEKMPIVQFIVGLRMEMLKFIRELVGRLDFVCRKTRKFASVFAASILGFALNPLLPEDMKPKEMSENLTSLLFRRKAVS
ncbi:MAG: HTH-type transcriptional regulator AcrR [Microgenomates group bacterium ADurb.Bin219]|nr:MAG: HTH-type transcriptional regulator AcrR [Microgenomates group bacterium ADurb.Bin219]HNP89224.1 TetR/AcrR family transcriptional regulator [Candidatus Woesebacteria bacterium]